MTLPPHCAPDSAFLTSISTLFNTCIPSSQSLLCTVLGIASIVSWVMAQIPQILKNYRRGSVEGLSCGFLVIWFAGDICNLLGAIWTNQMWFQKIIGGYYVFVDTLLVSQFLYFGFFHKATTSTSTITIDGIPISSSFDDEDDGIDTSSTGNIDDKKLNRPSSSSSSASSTSSTKKPPLPPRRTGLGVANVAHTMFVVASLCMTLAGALPTTSQDPTSRIRMANTVPPFFPGGIFISSASSTGAGIGGGGMLEVDLEFVGVVVSWISTGLYLISRFPQLLLNSRRRSTSGLSIHLFLAAFFGNLFYSTSLLTNPLGYNDYGPYGGGGIAGADGNNCKEWWTRTLPFFLGAAGVLGMDAGVGVQWLVWGEGEKGGEEGVVVGGGGGGGEGDQERKGGLGVGVDVDVDVRTGERRGLLAGRRGVEIEGYGGVGAAAGSAGARR